MLNSKKQIENSKTSWNDLKYCPRTKHAKGRHALKKATVKCTNRTETGECQFYPVMLKYAEANDIKLKIGMKFKCIVERKRVR